MNIETLRNIEPFLKSICPELSHTNLRVVFQDEAIDKRLFRLGYLRVGEVWGYTSPSLFYDLGDPDPEALHGVAMVICEKTIAEYACPGEFEKMVQSVAIHELSHIVEDELCTSVSIARCRRRSLFSLFDFHGEAFIRAAAHLYFRACLNGGRLCPFMIDPFLPRFLPSLQFEAFRKRSWPMIDVVTSQPPKSFRWKFQKTRDRCEQNEFLRKT